MKKLFTLALLGTVAAFGLVAADNPPVTPPGQEKKAEAKKPAPRALPFRGELKAVDQTAKTITVGERVFQITSQTRIMVANKPATLGDLKVGEDVRGAYRTTAENKLEAISVFAGIKPAAPARAKPAEKK